MLQPVRRRAVHIIRITITVLLLANAGYLLLQPEPLDQFRTGQRLLLRGHVQEAYQHYQNLHQSGVRRPELLLSLGHVYLLRGEVLKAKIVLIEALVSGLAPGQLDTAELAYGWSLALQGHYDRAEEIWQRVSYHLQGQVAMLRAEAYLHRAMLDAALKEERQALTATLSPLWRTYAAYRLALLESIIDPTAARRTLASIDLQTDQTWLLIPLGSWPSSLWEQRVARLQEALDMPPDERTLTVASLLAEEKLFAAAHAVLHRTESVALNERALLFDATLRRRQGDLSGAFDRLQMAIQHYPTSTSLLRLLALVQMEQQLPEARKTLDQAWALDSDSPDNAVIEAAFQRAAHDYNAAVAAYQQAIALAMHDQQPYYHFHAARFYYETTWHQCDAGLSHARAATKASDAAAMAWTLLGELLLRCGEWDQALQIGDTLIQQWPDEPAGHYIRGAALASLGRRDEAREGLLHAANLAPASTWRRRAESFLPLD